MNLIAGIAHREGLKIQASLDEKTYEAGVKVTDEESASLSTEGDSFHEEWNDRIKPEEKLPKCSSCFCKPP